MVIFLHSFVGERMAPSSRGAPDSAGRYRPRMPTQRIVACGGGLFDQSAAPLREFILGRARQANPRVCFLPTATGDHPEAIARFYRVAAQHECRPSDLPLFHREVADLAAFLAKQDVRRE